MWSYSKLIKYIFYVKTKPSKLYELSDVKSFLKYSELPQKLSQAEKI